MAPSRATYVAIKRRQAALNDPMNQALVNKAAPKGVIGVKSYWDKIAGKRNEIADDKFRSNRNITSFNDDEFKKDKVMKALQAKRAQQ